MESTLDKEFDELQSRLTSLRESVEAREEIQRQEAKERLERRQAALKEAETNSEPQQWALDRVMEPTWDEEQRAYIVRWRLIDRSTVRPYERKFNGLGDAIKHFQALMQQKTKEQRQQSREDDAAVR